MGDDKTSLKEVVATYLRKNPDFLEEFPDILEVLQLNHNSGVAVSLIERQIEQLREKNQELTRQMNNLVHVASENEQLMTRLHQLTLELMPINSRKEFFTHLGNSLLNDFKADILQIFHSRGRLDNGTIPGPAGQGSGNMWTPGRKQTRISVRFQGALGTICSTHSTGRERRIWNDGNW